MASKKANQQTTHDEHGTGRMDVLLVEDSPTDAQLLREALRNYPLQLFEIEQAETLTEAFWLLAGRPFDVILLDLDLPDSRGIQTAERVSRAAVQVPIIILTGTDDERLATEAMRLGVQDYLVKGYSHGNVIGRAVRYAVERRRSQQALQEANEQLQVQAEELQAQSEELQTQTEELRAVNDALEQREREYRTLAENAPEVIARFNRHLRHTYINGYGARVYGVPQSEVSGKTNAELGMPADQVAFWEERFEQVFTTGRQQTVDFEFDSPVLGHQYFSSLFVPEFDAYGRVASILAITRDVTAAQSVQAQLRRSEARLQRSQEIAHLGSWELDLVTNELTWSDEVYRIFGLAPQEFGATYEAFLEHVHPDDRQAVDDAYRSSVQAGQNGYEIEHRVIRKDTGEVRIVHEKCEHFRDGAGRIVRSVGMVHDITDRRRAGEALRESEQWFRTLANAMPQLVWTAEPDGRVDYYNDRYREFRGIEQAADGSFRWALVLHEDDVTATVAAWEHAVQTGETYQIEHRVQRADGSYHWYLSRGMPLRDGAGRIVKWFGTATDIDRVKQAEEALRELTATLDTRVAQRTAELRHRARQLQKLTLEMSEAEERERKRLAEILHDDLQQQLAAAKFHLGLLSTRLRGDASLQEAAADVMAMLKDALEKTRSLSHELSPALLYQGDFGEALEWLANRMQAKHGLVVHVETRGPAEISSDPIRAFLFRTAQEILFNIVKHARVTEATVRLQRRRGRLWLTISDRGQGFDPHTLEQAAGFGLLSIRERVELLGGRMRIRSAPGRGSTFLIAVPDGEAGLQGGGAPAQREARERLRVLLADDHEVVREGLALLLNEQEDIEVVGQAANGQEAVELAHQLQPDVVVMDVAMPLMEGDEATRQIKRDMPRTRVVGLSMCEEPATIERMHNAGVERYMLKTAPAGELLAAIREK